MGGEESRVGSRAERESDRERRNEESEILDVIWKVLHCSDGSAHSRWARWRLQ